MFGKSTKEEIIDTNQGGYGGGYNQGGFNQGGFNQGGGFNDPNYVDPNLGGGGWVDPNLGGGMGGGMGGGNGGGMGGGNGGGNGGNGGGNTNGGTTHHAIDSTGLNLIKNYESWQSCYYLDPTGSPTIGYGHLIKAGDPYKKGSCLTQQQGDALLTKDLTTFTSCVNALGVKLTQNQFDALVDLTFNCGCGSLSWGVSDLLKQNNYGAVCGWLNSHCTTSKGVSLPGLVARRAKECTLWNS